MRNVLRRAARWVTVRVLVAAAGLGAALGLYLALVPPVIDAEAWDPPPRPPVAATHGWGGVARLGAGVLSGPESVAGDDAGYLYVGCDDGVIYRLPPGGGAEPFAEVGGRPLGLAFDDEGRLLVANHPLGLQRVDPAGRVELLADEADGEPIHFANGVAVASSGVVYFTDSSDRYHLANGFAAPHGAYDMLEARPRGRLLRYDPHRRAAETLADDLFFPNGVALSPDELTVYVAETFRHRVLAYGLMSGDTGVFAGNLPGFPDGLARDPATGGLVVAIGVRRGFLADAIQPYPWLKNQITKFPRALWEHVRPEPIVLFLDGEGGVAAVLHDPTGALGLITSPLVAGDALYLGTLDRDHLLRVERPAFGIAEDRSPRREDAKEE